MKVNLYVRYEDVDKYIRGEGIIASTEKNKGYIFNDSEIELINVNVDVGEIVSSAKKEMNGMVRGRFTYYCIQKNLFLS